MLWRVIVPEWRPHGLNSTAWLDAWCARFGAETARSIWADRALAWPFSYKELDSKLHQMPYNPVRVREWTMKAISRLRGASYSPETVRAMLKAFDAAWAAVHFHFYESPDCYEAARLRLASAILAAAALGDRDARRLTNAGLLSMSMRYRLGSGDFGAGAIMSDGTRTEFVHRKEFDP
jgi:hypothetical protein